MTGVLVDSNVILDVLTEDETWGEWSSGQIERLGDEITLIINPLIYAEVSVRFTAIEELDDALSEISFRREALPYTAAFLAGKQHLAYRRRGGARSLPLPDFFIGAHAAVAEYRLLTRDIGRYRTYFPTVGLIAPD
jgi:predicted nucleic acid-binding protein